MSLYRFLKSSSSSMSDSQNRHSSSKGPSRRLFVQGTREKDDRDNIKDIVPADTQDLQAVHTRRHITTDVEGSSHESSKMSRKSSGAKYVTTRIVRKTTTLTRGEEKSVKEDMMRSSENSLIDVRDGNSTGRSYHSLKSKRARISDIVVGEEPNVTAREALMKWARRSTSKYPGVRIGDFTSSWRDGLAFNAIIHRNRPDLIDWRNIKTRTVRERLETAFYVAEKDYGVTRLLDPEDVERHEIDEKSMITYVSSLYDAFPEPPSSHPLYDTESQQKTSEYRDLASSLHLWIREKTSLMSDRNFPSTLIEMKKVANESNRFRTEEVPPRHRDKQKLQYIYRDLQKYFESVGEVDLEPELHVDVIDRNWNRLMIAHQERDQTIHDEIKRLDKLQRLAEKVHREMKRVDTKMDDLESKINEEARRLERLHPLDAKHNVDLLEQDLRLTEEHIQSLFSDVQTLRDGRYSQAGDLQKRVEKLHERWVGLRSLLHSRLISPLSSLSFPVVEERTVTRQTRTILETRLVDTNPHFRNLQECIEWCSKKLKQIQEADYGSDLPGVQAELNTHLREHNAIEQFHLRVDQCINAKNYFQGDELTLYTQHLNQLQKLYTELITTSNKRLSDLETLQDFLQSANNQLVWLNEKEEIELTRDWSDRDLNTPAIQQYYDSLMSELEKREIQFSAVQDRGESLLLQHHPASKCIQAYVSAMVGQWSWILQLTFCLETHLKHATYYQQFYKDVKEAETWLNKRDELLNTVYSQSEFSLDEGERLLKGMQELREELNQYGEVVGTLSERARNVAPLKQRRLPVTRPIPVLAICNYKQGSVNIEKGDQWILHDNSGRIKWRVSSSSTSTDTNIPGVIFLIPPPDKEALEAIERLRRQFDRSLALWQRKQLRMRQNMIFATIKVVKSWDLAQFLAMGDDQRNAIRKALNEDANKLLEEGDPSDPQLRRLRREMDEVNRLFDEFERKARMEEESKNATRLFNEQAAALQSILDEAEHTLNTRLNTPIPRDLDSLEDIVIQHNEFETRLRDYTSDIDRLQETFKSIARKTPALQNKLDKILNQWNNIWNSSHLYVERLKCVENVLRGIEEVGHTLSDFEVKLASYGEMPSDLESLKAVHKDLLSLQSKVTMQQPVIDQLLEDGHNTRRVVEKSRHHVHNGGAHHDLDRMDTELNRITTRWNNICSQLVDRLRNCDAAYKLLEAYGNAYENEVKIIEVNYQDLNNLPTIHAKTIEQIEPTKKLFTKVMNQTPAIEQVNIAGGRFVREAKIYDLRLHHYCDWLIDEIHPSLEASLPNRKRVRLERLDSGSGEAIVSRDLDALNNRHQALLSILHDRLKQMVLLYPEDKELKEFVEEMQPKQLRTFRTEFTIYEQPSDEPDATYRLTNGVENGVNGINGNDIENLNKMGNQSATMNGGSLAGDSSMKFNEIRSLRRVNKNDDVIGTDSFDITNMRGIIHPETGVILTVEDAIRLRILDVRTGKIATDLTSKSSYITIEEAVGKGLILPELAARLLGPCGVAQDGSKGQMSLLEAIQRELLDAELGPMERLKVSDDVRDSSSIADSECFVMSDGKMFSLSEAYDSGLLPRTQVTNVGLSLSDLMSNRLTDEKGLIFDRNTGNKYEIKKAISKNILNGDFYEIVDAKNDVKITVKNAIDLGIIKNGKYKHGLSDESLSLKEAKRRKLILKPLSLRECVDMDIVEKGTMFKSPTHGRKLTFLEAISKGVIDFNIHKTIVNPKTQELMTLSKALECGVITRKCEYYDEVNDQTISLEEAVEGGFIFSVNIVSAFDINTFKDETEFISLNTAMDRQLMSKKENVITFQGKSIEEGLKDGIVKEEVFGLLSKKIGIWEEGVELNALETVVCGFVNPMTGLVIDKRNKTDVPFNTAIKKNLITADGLANLKALLTVALSTQTLTKTVIRHATTVELEATEKTVSLDIEPKIEKKKSVIKSKIIKMLEPLQSKKNQTEIIVQTTEVPPEGWLLENAIKEGLFDPVGGLLTIPGTDRLVSFEECIKFRIIDANSAQVLDPEKPRYVSLGKALEKHILDCTGFYKCKSGEKITMENAIAKCFIKFSEGAQETSSILEPLQILPGAIFDPQSSLIIFHDQNISLNLLDAIKDKKINPTDIKLKFMDKDLNMAEAIAEQSVDVNEGVVSTEEGGKISFSEAVKTGLIIIAGTPLALVKSLSENSSKITDSNLPIDVQKPSLEDLTRSRVTTEPKFLLSVGKAKMIPQDEGHPVIVQRMVRKRMNIKDALKKGIIDEETASILNEMNGSEKEIKADKGAIYDVNEKKYVPVKEALKKGILKVEHSTVEILMPVSRGLTASELYKQGLIHEGHVIHPETGALLTLEEALQCEIVDSSVGQLEGAVTPLEFKEMKETLEKGPKSVDKVKEDSRMDLQALPVAMTLKVAEKRGIYDPLTNEFTHPILGYKIPLTEAVNHGLIADLSSLVVNEQLDSKVEEEGSDMLENLSTGQVYALSEALDSNTEMVKGTNLSICKAIQAGLLTIAATPLLISKSVASTLSSRPTSLQHEPYKKILITKHLNEKNLYGLFEEGEFINPETNEKIPFKNWILNDDIFKVEEIVVKNLEDNTWLTVKEALELGYLNEDKGFIIDPCTGKKVSFLEAVKLGWITQAGFSPHKKEMYEYRALDTLVENADESADDLIIEGKNKEKKSYTLKEAASAGIISPEMMVMKDTMSDKYVSLKEMIDDGKIDLGIKIKIDEYGKVIIENTLKESYRFSEAIEKGYLDLETGKYTDPDTKQVLSLKDSLNQGYIDPTSALFKDYTNKGLLTLSDAFNKGLIDPIKYTVFDTSLSRIYTFSEAYDMGLVTTKGLSVLEVLDFGLYNPVDGQISNPFSHNVKFSLKKSLNNDLVDKTSVMVRDTKSGNIVTFEEAIRMGIIEAERSTFFDTNTETITDLVKARNAGYIIATESRQAIEKKYRLCDDTLNDLLAWVGEIEDRIANQDVAQEDINQLRNQINILKLLKEEIASQVRAVSTCLDQVRHVVATGSEYLSRDEINNLERKGKSLRTRYDRSNDKTDHLLRRLLGARDELTKFKNDLGIFTTWMGKAEKTLEDKEKALGSLNRGDGWVESTREFVSDVIAHQADLRFITMASQKFLDESKEYLASLNEFRTGLPQRLLEIEPVSVHDSVVKNTVTAVKNQYKDLLTRVNALSDKLTGLGSKQRDYRDALNAAKNWIRDAEPRANKILLEPVAADPNTLEDQLTRAKALNQEFISQGRLIDNAKQALDSLLRSLDGQITKTEANNLEFPVLELEDKYKQLCNALSDKLQILDSALIQSQGVQDALDGLLQWLNNAENTLKNLTRPASLHRERLEEQIREHRSLQSDVDSHRASVDKVAQSAQELIATASSPRLAKKIESKLNDVTSRFEKLLEKTARRGGLLLDIQESLTSFNEQASSLERWLNNALEILTEASGDKVEELAVQRDSQKQALDQTVRDGKALINNKDVTDTAIVRDRVKALENQWKELNSLLDDKQRASKLKSEQLLAYDKLRDQVTMWLNNMEIRVNRLEPVALDIDVIKKQTEELKPIAKEHRDYGLTIDKLNDLGNAYESLIRSDTPTRRISGGVSPSKRNRISPIMRRGSQDLSPSKSQFLTPNSMPRRPSQDGFLIEELTQVQEELSEINSRYNTLGVRISDRQSELDNIRDELRRQIEHLKALSQFLDKIQRLLPKENIPQTKEEADKTTKQIKGLLEEIYEKQALLESTRSGVNDLLRKKPTAQGANVLHDDLQDVTSRWKNLHDSCKDRIQILEDIKDFHDTHDNLSNWLSAKDKMMTVLGPISSDSRMVQSQVQQVQVLREEFRTQQPQLNHLTSVGESVLSRIPDRKSSDGQKISNKLSNIQKRWNELLARLDERAASLGAAADTSREFDVGLARLRDALQSISDNLDEIPLDKEPEEQLRKIQNLERQLEGQRPLLADLEAAGAQLCDVLSDPTSRAEIQGKLSSVNRQYNNLQKKLDHRKAEIENLLRDGRQFEATCAQSLGWLTEQLGSLSERLLISADRDILQQQLDNHEPIYKDVLNKEHEIIMLLNKGRDLLSRNNKTIDSRNLQRDIDKIQQQWDKLKKEAVDRQTRLQTCMEHCKKYYRALDTFIPWLSQAENKLDSLRPDSFKRKDVERQLRELSSFRNDVWKHSGEFENLKTLGETFLAACDVDKELVKRELAAVKARWDRLNNELLERMQWLEDTARKLTDFSENLRDLGHSVQRCEDKLASHDALGGAARDPKMLERIKGLRDDVAKLRKPLQAVKQTAKDLVAEATGLGVGDASHLLDEVDTLGERLDDLQAKLDDRCSRLQSASTALAQYNERVKGLAINLNELDQELDSMKPPGRDLKTVQAQLDDVHRFIKKLNDASNEVSAAAEAGERLVDSGFSPDTTATREQIDNLTRQLNKLDDKAKLRQNDLDNVLEKLQYFHVNHVNALEDISNASDELKRLKPVGSEVDAIRSQQEEFATFRRLTIEPVAQSVDMVNKLGQGLIQSAANGVNTSSLEKDLEKLNDRWNTLKDNLNTRDRKLDVGLLQSGKFQEALAGLEKWLTDTEEMVANQKPPSADYKVVKAQLQEQKFLKKMLLDRQNSMSSIFSMGNEVAAGADANERRAIERQLRDLMQRFDNLTDGAARRMEALEKAMEVAKEFQDKLLPLLEWLDYTEKKVKDMELVPTDEDKIQKRIREHDALHNDILRKKPAFTELTEVASALMGLVGDDEAAGVADKLQDTADRYTALVDASDNVRLLLQSSKGALRHLVLTYQDLQAWMEATDNKLNRYKILPVHTEKLIRQIEDLDDILEEISHRQGDVDGTVDSGTELMKSISNDEALQLKDKLDSLQRRYNDLLARSADLLKQAQEALPLVQQFHNSHNRLVDWMMEAESQLQSAEPREEEISRLLHDIQEFRPVLENINLIGPQLCQVSPGEGAATIEGLVSRDNRRFDAIVEQIQRKAERIQLSKQRTLEVMGDIDELLDWFREVDNQLRDAEPPSCEADIIRLQLKEHRTLNDDISSQKGRVRDVISTAKKVLRESAPTDDLSTIREKMEDLKEIMDTVSGLSSNRLSILEQALPLAEHFNQSHGDLAVWFDEMEHQVAMLAMPALRPDLIAIQQDRNEIFVQSINEHKPLVEKLNKTGEALIKLVNHEDGGKVQDILDTDNARYAALRAELRQRQQALEKALQETSQFSDKLEGMLRALANTADQVSGADPISAHPPRIRDQIDENGALVEDLDKREEAFQAVKRAANDVINKAPNASDPAVKDMKRKLDRLNSLWNEVQRATSDRGRSLEEALKLAEKFWDELQGVMATLHDLQNSLNSQEPPAVQPAAIQQQQEVLQEIKAEIDQTKPEVEQCRASGHQLMRICGEPDKPEVKKHIEDLDNAWDNITALFAKREENLINAMEKAMEFHETLQDILDFLDKAENKFARLGPLGSDIDAVKYQISQLKQFKSDVDPIMVKVEALNRQAQELTERTSAEQAAALKEPLSTVNRRWEDLLRGIVERQRQLENALLRLGQFHHALAELLAWIGATDKTLDNELKPVAGDPQLLEVELAKLKVLVNDIQAHQSSVDTLNDAGRQLIESGKGTDEASATQDKLNTLNKRWKDLLQKAADRQLELEESLRDAQRFAAEIQDLLSWLGEVDGIIAASKPVGGLPETANEQLERFMEIYNELEENKPKVETVLAQGQDYLKKSTGTASNLQHNLRTLKQRWDSVLARANDKKIKLEIALKEAREFHEALQSFIDWLTNAEKTLSNLKPVSRVLQTILHQIEDHKVFQKDVSAHREAMLHLDKKGTHLKYFSQKQDVILIKNLLISAQHRWERVVAKSAERTRALDHGYKEAKEFHDAWSGLMSWLSETEKGLDDLAVEASSIGNDPDKIKQRLAKHREFQRALASKQGAYDSTMRMGKTLKERAPKSDDSPLKQMIMELKDKWNSVCAKAVDRQRKLEEALLYCGQFKDALEALLDWLRKAEKKMSDDGPVHGDLDTVTALIDQHRAFEQDLAHRAQQLESVKDTAEDLISKASADDAKTLKAQLNDIDSLWSRTNKLTEKRSNRLLEALKDAEELHKRVHMLLEWLSDAEMKLRFAGALPDDEQELRNQLNEHERFMRELVEKEQEKNSTISLAQNILAKAHPDAVNAIKHWITIIQSRWDEVSTWAKQRDQRLRDHLRSQEDMDSLLEELLAWLFGLESNLIALDSEPLPEEIPAVEKLIEEHKDFMLNVAQKQHDVDSICKAKQVTLQTADRKAPLRKTTPGRKEEKYGSNADLVNGNKKTSFKSSRDNLLDRKGRTSPGLRDKADANVPHIGPRFPPKGSKGAEITFRNSRFKQLWDKWRSVWNLAWERQKKLYDHLEYLKELEKVRNFSWDDWRKRFLRFINHKKSRLTDLFRKMDKNNDGLVTRDDFIDGIMKTKFDTSKMEMGAVADMFDHDKAGLIDWKEFIAALRPDWEERPPSEAEKIHDEVKRLVMLCTCRQKFRVFQVGEGKYRFGDSQKLRLVRILRSTVMVRVGGGWVALDEFLVKNDPCRVEMLPMPNPYAPEEHEPWCPYSSIQLNSKGRTNIELREQFILADGVSQSMSAFKPKHSTTNQRPGSSLSTTTGPITKIRERSTKSVPMSKQRTIGTPDSLSDNESSQPRTPSRRATPSTYKSPYGGSLPASRGNSRPASRTGSKPPSRHGSNLSLDSTDDGTPSRIPRRSGISSSKTSITGRKLTPTLNGSVNSSRSVSGFASPVSDSKSISIYRTSSIPTLSSNSSSSRIPVYSRQSPSADVSQKTYLSSSSSGNKTPVGNNVTTKSILRKSSGASDIGKKNSRTEGRAPFRL